MPRGTFQLQPNPLAKRLLPLAYGLVAMVAFILLLTWATLQVQTALAGFLNGESVWSKAEKQATIDLLDYATTGDPTDYSRVERDFAVLDAMRLGSNQVLSGHFDYATVEDELRRGDAMPVAIPSVIFMLDHFSNAPYMRDALRTWRSTDGAVGELHVIADELHRAYGSGPVSEHEISLQRGRINALNNFIQPRSNQFSVTIADG
ncbi:MAG TPA: diguanylate cyclase, partial [Rhodanobacteraceae bacterium]|nr:diguanylate cyclase [Rhodanobacteraceae bacterium]